MKRFPCAIERHKYRGKIHEMEPYCFYCGKPVTWKNSTLDHLLPISRGGEDCAENVVLCCKACNQSKGNKTLEEWIERLQIAKDRLILGAYPE